VPEPDASGRVAGVAGRGLGLLILVVLAWQVLAQGLTLPSGGALGFIHGVNLVFHEAGHVIFGFFGEFIAALGGSLNQVLIPLIATIAFLRTRQRASAAVALFWTGQSITDVAIYAANGRARALPLLAEGLIHDWSYILGRLGLLGAAETVGRLLFAAGVLTMLVAILFLALELLRCLNAPPPREELDAGAR
jgi:hypothetical protein